MHDVAGGQQAGAVGRVAVRKRVVKAEPIEKKPVAATG
jgi:hypothetical protein